MKDTDEVKIKKAVHILNKSYGVVGLKNMYLLATDIDGDLRIKPMGIVDKMLWDMDSVSQNNFVKIKDLISADKDLEVLARSYFANKT